MEGKEAREATAAWNGQTIDVSVFVMVVSVLLFLLRPDVSVSTSELMSVDSAEMFTVSSPTKYNSDSHHRHQPPTVKTTYNVYH